MNNNGYTKVIQVQIKIRKSENWSSCSGPIEPKFIEYQCIILRLPHHFDSRWIDQSMNWLIDETTAWEII